MNSHWSLPTHGDPLGTLQGFLRTVWDDSGLESMLVPLDGQTDRTVQPRVIRDVALLSQVNPFKPLMTVNAARMIPGLVASTQGRIGVLLRPCEMRALVEIASRKNLDLTRLLTISVDCLGTFPPEEFIWRAAVKGSPDELAQESLQFARQGGIMAYRYRSACQLCIAPNAHGADLNIGVLGLPVRQQMLVSAQREAVVQELRLESLTAGPASTELVAQRQSMLAKLAERRGRTRDRVARGISDILPPTVDALIEQLNECAPCQKCLEACPICSFDFPQKDAEQGYARDDILQWLISCAGCGMCEQACPKRQPLSVVFSHIRQQLADELGILPLTS
ncbi:MAG: Coenzyme F420 hydrogenase/dehydrogenase, beta subunit C-terminal domain [Chloroflexi bacterium]|nr:Coenzyme F420 hydrogenase/dehydrogenase, beta subunit C-terminal domain [Chloroflexota bacterium]